MYAWIKAEDDAVPVSGPYWIVPDPKEASNMSEANAREIWKRASLDFREYDWEMVPCSTGIGFLLQGLRKNS